MHTFGHPCKIDRIVDIYNLYHIPVVEDAAESIGSYYKGKHTGIFGKSGILSFNGHKTTTTGGGGMILTNDDELGPLAKHITTTAKKPHPRKFEHNMIGYNYRLPNINIALGCAQMEILSEILQNKRETAIKYQEFFNKIDDIEFIKEPSDSMSNYWFNAILLNKEEERDQFLDYAYSQKVMCRPARILMNKLPMFVQCICSTLNVENAIEKRLVKYQVVLDNMKIIKRFLSTLYNYMKKCSIDEKDIIYRKKFNIHLTARLGYLSHIVFKGNITIGAKFLF